MSSEPEAKWLLRLEKLRQKRLKAQLAEDYRAAGKVEPKIRRMETIARINRWVLPRHDQDHEIERSD